MSASSAVAETTFVGREGELAEGERLLGETRLLTVTGPGGAGKTRYAFELARRTAGRYEEVVPCLFASLRDPALVLPTVARALELPDSRRGVLDVIAERLGDREALLVLDNLEHLLAAASDLFELPERCPGVTLVCTSRSRLGGERELPYELPPLADDEAVRLFCERARVEPTDTIVELCRRLDGLPLAIELAAARLSLLSAEQLLERLSRRLDLLKGPPHLDPRQQTVRATIQWSYDLLAPVEQHVLERLSVFDGGCTLEAAEDVCGADAAVLECLADRSLVRRADGRYAMLETIREFSEERLEESGESDEIRHRHALYMSALAAPADEGFDAGVDPLPLLGPEHANLRQALAFLERSGLNDLGLELVGRSWYIWYACGASPEGLRWAELFLDRERDEPSGGRAKALLAASVFACWTGDLAEAEEYAAESLPLLTQFGEERSVPALLTNLGLVAWRRGDLAAATCRLNEAACAARESENAFQLAVASGNLAELAMIDGAYDRAGLLVDEMWTLFDSLGVDWGRGWALISRAYLLYCLEDDEQSLRLAAQAIRCLGRTIDSVLAPPTAVLVAALAVRRGAHEVAARLIGCADATTRGFDREWLGMEVELRRQALGLARAALGDERCSTALSSAGAPSSNDLARRTLEVAEELGAGSG